MRLTLTALWCGLLCVFLLAKPGARKADGLLSIAGRYVEDTPVGIASIDSFRFVVYETDSGSYRYFVVTSDFVNLIGYKGYTNLGVLLDDKAGIIKVWIISSDDTRHYVNKIKHSGMLDQFCAASKGRPQKTVTGATITSKTICRTIERMKSILNPKIGEMRDVSTDIRDHQKE